MEPPEASKTRHDRPTFERPAFAVGLEGDREGATKPPLLRFAPDIRRRGVSLGRPPRRP